VGVTCWAVRVGMTCRALAAWLVSADAVVGRGLFRCGWRRLVPDLAVIMIWRS
jgi:hypothetical protein